jgi:hypothetical protein
LNSSRVSAKEAGMVLDLTNFTMIGLLLGVLIRFFVATDRDGPAVPLLATVAPGIVGALLGGMAAWYFWPTGIGQFHIGGVGTAILGGVVAILLALAVLRHKGSIG